MWCDSEDITEEILDKIHEFKKELFIRNTFRNAI